MLRVNGIWDIIFGMVIFDDVVPNSEKFVFIDNEFFFYFVYETKKNMHLAFYQLTSDQCLV